MADPILSQEVAKRVGFGTVPAGGNATAGKFPRFTGTGLTIEEADGGGVIQQTVTVAKAGGQFTTIQAAINSITDATSTKQYMINIYPGDYNEQLVLKPYIHYNGVGGFNTCRITPQTTGSCITFGTNTTDSSVYFYNLSFVPIATVAITMFDFTGISFYYYLRFYNCSISLTSNNSASKIMYGANSPCSMSFYTSQVTFARSSVGGGIAFDLGQQGWVLAENTSFAVIDTNADTGNNDLILFSDISNMNQAIRSYTINLTVCKLSIFINQPTANLRMIMFQSLGDYGKFSVSYCTITSRSTNAVNAAMLMIFNSQSTSNIIASSYNSIIYITAYLATKTLLNYGTATVTFNSFQDSWAGHTNVGSGILTFNVLGAPDNNLFRLPAGSSINEFSTDGTLAGNSDTAVPTEQAVKTYALGFATPPVGGNATVGRLAAFTGTGVTVSEAVGWYGDNYRTVNASGGAQYTTVQAAIDSIADATTTKRYAIYIYPGSYTESITTKPDIDFFGTKSEQTSTSIQLIANGGSVVTVPVGINTGSSNGFYNLSIKLNLTNIQDITSVYTVIDVTGTLNGGAINFYNCLVSCGTKNSASKIINVPATITNFGINFFSGCNVYRADIVPIGTVPTDSDTVIGIDATDALLVATDSLFQISTICLNRTHIFYRTNNANMSNVRTKFTRCTLKMSYAKNTAGGLMYFCYNASAGAPAQFVNSTMSLYRSVSGGSSTVGSGVWIKQVGSGGTPIFKILGCVHNNLDSLYNIDDSTLFDGFSTNTLEIYNSVVPMKIVGSPIINTFATKVAAYTVLLSDKNLILGGTASYAVTLPLAATSPGFEIEFMKTSTNTYTDAITPTGTDNINGVNAAVNMTTQYSYLKLFCDGTQYLIKSAYLVP